MAQEFFVTFNLNKKEGQVAEFTLQNHSVNGSFQMRPNERDHENLYNRDKDDQHPINAITGLQEALTGLKGFVFEQGVSSMVWDIRHNLNRKPSITVVDEYDRIVEGQREYKDNNRVVITFNAAFKGKAYLN